MSKKEKEVKPVYKFAEVPEGEINPGSPLKKRVAKTMEVTEHFTIYEVMQYIEKMKKAKADKQAEIDGLDSMIEAYEKELNEIKESLSIDELQAEYEKFVAEDAAKAKAEAEAKEKKDKK